MPLFTPDPVIANKNPARVATTANITLSGLQTIDNVALAAGDRVLVKDQTTASQNGIYVVAAGAWARASDMAFSQQVGQGVLVNVTSGQQQSDTLWTLVTDPPIVLGTTSLNFRIIRSPALKQPTDVTNTSNTAAVDVPGLAIPVLANEWMSFQFFLVIDAAATTTGVHLSVNGPASPTQLTWQSITPLTVTTDFNFISNAYEAYPTATNIGTSPGTTRSIAQIMGMVKNGSTAGSVVPRLRSEVNASQVAVRSGSWAMRQ